MTDQVDPTEPLMLGSRVAGLEPVLAAVVRSLAGPAHPSELATEVAVVDLMVLALEPTQPLKERQMKHHFARYVAIAAVAVISATGVAAAATGTNPLGMPQNGRLGPPAQSASDTVVPEAGATVAGMAVWPNAA